MQLNYYNYSFEIFYTSLLKMSSMSSSSHYTEQRGRLHRFVLTTRPNDSTVACRAPGERWPGLRPADSAQPAGAQAVQEVHLQVTDQAD
jgi:hypothetical protein